MKRVLLSFVVLALMSCDVVYAGWATSKISFKAYSTQTAVECGVFGMKRELPRMGDSRDVAQGFYPDPNLSRTMTLGTKGMANYSTLYTGAVSWTCRNTNTNTLVKVKVMLNAVQTHFLTMDSGTWFIGQ